MAASTMGNIRAVLFDFDDTLVDTFGSKVPAIIEFCFEEYGLEVRRQEVEALWGRPFKEMIAALNGGRPVDISRYLKVSERYPLKAFSESGSVLDVLGQRYKLGIVTSLSREVLLHSLRHLEWRESRFCALVAEGEAVAHKPDPRVFEPAMMSLAGVSRGEVLYVGDAVTDALAAQGAGIQFVGIARDLVRRKEFETAGFPCRPSLQEVATEVLC